LTLFLHTITEQNPIMVVVVLEGRYWCNLSKKRDASLGVSFKPNNFEN